LRRERTAAFTCHFVFGCGARFVPIFFRLWRLFLLFFGGVEHKFCAKPAIAAPKSGGTSMGF
jgi:hypothetical protein